MVLTLEQYNLLFGKKKKSSSRGNFLKLSGQWDVSMWDQDSMYKWGLCYSDGDCHGVPYLISSQFSSGQRKEIEKGMKEIELETCIR